MIRKSTLLILLVAIAAGGGLYYYEQKHPATDATAGTPADAPSKPVFPSMTSGDIQSITLQHLPAADAPIQMARAGEGWQLTQPLKTGADASSVQGIADGLAAASSSGTEPNSPDRLKAYGLAPGRLSISFTMKNGTTHKVTLGDKDFTNANVYALVDSNPDVYLLPNSLLTSTDKTAEDLRDRSVLHLDADQAATTEMKTAASDIILKKSPSGWDMTKPEAAAADSDAVTSIISSVATGKMMAVASETADNLAKYGLTTPAVTFIATNDIGQASTLVVGKKQGDNYYAHDISRPTIFEIDEALYKKLTQSAGDVLDKTPIHVDESTIAEIQIHDSNGDMTADKKAGSDDWTITAPDSVKGKPASSWRIFATVGGLRADEVIEKPSSDVTAALAQPVYILTLTDTAGKKRTLKATKEIGDFIYVQSSDAPSVYKLKKASLGDLDIKPADLAS
jgi:hypothetical protein